MPGPKSQPTLDGRRIGKTEKDRRTGKWARRLTNRHTDPIREHGGKQFGK
jgi:hypothetical protein